MAGIADYRLLAYWSPICSPVRFIQYHMAPTKTGYPKEPKRNVFLGPIVETTEPLNKPKAKYTAYRTVFDMFAMRVALAGPPPAPSTVRATLSS